MSKRALVIANTAYQDGSILTCCENDARDMADQLHTIGFQVNRQIKKKLH